MKWFLLIIILVGVMLSGCLVQRESQVKFSKMKLVKIKGDQPYSMEMLNSEEIRVLIWEEIKTGKLYYSYNDYGELNKLYKVGDVVIVFVKR